MKIERFEDIKAWQEARGLKKAIHKVTRKPQVRKDYSFCDQIQRAATSIMSNIAEGFESQSDPDFVKFLYYAKRSAGEVRSQLYEALDQEYVSNKEFEEIFKQATYVSSLISKLITYLSKSIKSESQKVRKSKTLRP